MRVGRSHHVLVAREETGDPIRNNGGHAHQEIAIVTHYSCKGVKKV